MPVHMPEYTFNSKLHNNYNYCLIINKKIIQVKQRNGAVCNYIVLRPSRPPRTFLSYKYQQNCKNISPNNNIWLTHPEKGCNETTRKNLFVEYIKKSKIRGSGECYAHVYHPRSNCCNVQCSQHCCLLVTIWQGNKRKI